MRHSHILTECRSHTLTPPFCILRAVLYQTVELELQCSTFSQSCDSGFAQCVQARVRLRRRRRPGKVRRWDSPSPDCHLSSEELQHCSRRKRTGVSSVHILVNLFLLISMIWLKFAWGWHGFRKLWPWSDEMYFLFKYEQLSCSAQIWNDARFVIFNISFLHWPFLTHPRYCTSGLRGYNDDWSGGGNIANWSHGRGDLDTWPCQGLARTLWTGLK